MSAWHPSDLPTLLTNVGNQGKSGSDSDIVKVSRMARLRHADGLLECLLIGVDRKSSVHPQNVAFDPKRSLAAVDHADRPRSSSPYWGAPLLLLILEA